MNKKSAHNILKDSGHNNIVELTVKKNYFLAEHTHDFDVDIIIISGQLEIVTDFTYNLLIPGSRFKLKKNTIHTEKTGKDAVFFLSARPV
jgi:quercetin dioxygenase-like cupin family protein